MIGLQKRREEAAAAKEEARRRREGESGEDARNRDGTRDAESGERDGIGWKNQGQKKCGVSAAEMSQGRPLTGRGRGAFMLETKNGRVKNKIVGRNLRPGEIRIQRDISELDGGDCVKFEFPNPSDLMNFQVVVCPDDGYWKGYRYTFSFAVPDMYPHEPPIVKCLDKIYHPNIDIEGNVCLNILRADWKPVLDINSVIYGLIVLFVQPNPDDPLNHQAAEMLRTNQPKFRQNVMRSLQGMSVDSEWFPPAKRAS